MRWSFLRAGLMVTLWLAWLTLVLSPAAAAPSRQTNDWATEFLRTHPGYRGYLTPQPPYPLDSKAKHEQGDSIARVTFAKEGQVVAVEMIKSSGYQSLDTNSINYIKANWRSTFGQKKVLDVPLNYRL